MIAVIFITGLIIFLLSFRKSKFCFEWHAKLNRRPSKLKKKKQNKAKQKTLSVKAVAPYNSSYIY